MNPAYSHTLRLPPAGLSAREGSVGLVRLGMIGLKFMVGIIVLEFSMN